MDRQCHKVRVRHVRCPPCAKGRERGNDPVLDQGVVHDLSVRALQERLAELERWEKEQSAETAQEFEFCARQERQPEAQEALESELLAKMEFFKCVHESWMLDQGEIVQKRDELHRMLSVRHADWRDRHWLGPAPVLGGIGWHQHQFQGLHVNTDNEQLLVGTLGDGLICVNRCMVGDAGQLLCDGDRLGIKVRTSSKLNLRFLRAQRLTHCERLILASRMPLSCWSRRRTGQMSSSTAWRSTQ